MKKILTYLTAVLFVICLAGAPSLACDGPNCSASGNFDISTFAAGGGADCALETIPNGIAGGISGAGGISVGEASGQFSSFRFFRRTITLGGAGADLNSVAGGVTNTYDYVFSPGVGDIGIGVGSVSDSSAITAGSLHVEAWGLAESHGEIAGLAGQGSLNGSLIGPSPLCCWTSKGISTGLAGQGSLGGFIGGGIAAGLGSADVEAGIEMSGQSGSESYRAIDWFDGGKTEIMGTNVFANTVVTSYGNVDTCLIGCADVEGGFVAGGMAASLTCQKTNNGVAKATSIGVYAGAGELGCSFNGNATGYTQTTATTINGYNGSIMSSSAGMKVSSKRIPMD